MKNYSIWILWKYGSPSLWIPKIEEVELETEIVRFLEWMKIRTDDVKGFAVNEEE